MRTLFLIIILFTSLLPSVSQAQEPLVFESEYVKADITHKEVLDESSRLYKYQAQPSSGGVIEFQSTEDHFGVGTSVYLEHYIEADEYVFVAVNRINVLSILLLLFVCLVLWFTGKKGIRALIALSLSFVLLVFGLIPLLLKGYDPVWLALVFGSLILFLSIFVTHGFTRQSTISFIGSGISILIATLIVTVITNTGFFSGITDHSALFLSQYSESSINFIRLFAAAVIIGTLGVLDDITITQVSVVRELSESSHEARSSIFTRALRVGKDHISSLVNTLVFAYIGSALPLIMFTTQVNTPFSILISQEFIAAEIVRTFVGAIALIIAVPITTWCATYPFFRYLKKDKKAVVAHHCH